MLTWSTTLVSSLRLLEFAPVGFELSDRTFAKPNTAALNQALRFLLGESLFRAGECWPAETSAQRTAFRRAAQAALARLEASGDMPPGSSQASRLVSAGGPRVQQLLCFLADYRLRARLADVATATATAAAGGAQDEAAYGDGGEAEADAVEARTAAAAADPALLPLDSTALALRLGCDRARAARAAQRLRGRLAEALAEERSWAARDAQLRAAAAESVAELDRLRVARGELWRGGGGGGGGGDGDGDKQEEGGEEEAVRLALSELGALRRSRRVEGLQAAWAALAQHAEGAGGGGGGGGGGSDGSSALAAQDAVLQTVVGAAAAAAAVEASTAVGAGAADQAAAVPDLAVRLRAWAAGTEVVARALGDGAQTSDCPLDSWGSQLERLRSTATAAAAQAAQLEQLEVACEEQKAATADSVAELRRRVAALLDDADGGGDGSDRENSMASAQPSLRSPSSQPRRQQQQQQQQQQLQQRRRQCRRDGAAARAPPSAVERRALAPATPAAGPGSRTAAHYAHYRSQTDRARSTAAAPSQPSPSPPPSPADTAAFDRLAKLVAKRQQKGWGSAH